MGLVFDIKRYSINDGPGIRTTIFLKGCPLSCVWCHNPEGISRRPQLLYTANRCIGCGTCAAVCPVGAIVSASAGKVIIDRNLCKLCGDCCEECPGNALEISGIDYTVEEIMKEVEKERVFMENSGGGVTFCGGEPLMQPEFLVSLLESCRERGIHTAVDTSLYAPSSMVEKVAEKCDLFLVDLKLMDKEKHILYCGVPNDLILENLRLLSKLGKMLIIRIPLIEGVNSDERNMEESVSFLKSLGNVIDVEILSYHDIGAGKHAKLGTHYNPQGFSLGSVTDEKLRIIQHHASSVKP